MSTTAIITPEALSLLQEGWIVLVKQLGIQKATRFVLLLERGQGDSVEDIAQYWGDKSIDEIHHQVKMWKTQQPLQ
jgi:hypothetical protein